MDEADTSPSMSKPDGSSGAHGQSSPKKHRRQQRDRQLPSLTPLPMGSSLFRECSRALYCVFGLAAQAFGLIESVIGLR